MKVLMWILMTAVLGISQTASNGLPYVTSARSPFMVRVWYTPSATIANARMEVETDWANVVRDKIGVVNHSTGYAQILNAERLTPNNRFVVDMDQMLKPELMAAGSMNEISVEVISKEEGGLSSVRLTMTLMH